MSKGTEATVVLLTKNGGSSLRGCLERVFSQETDAAYEVLAIDSGSTDGTLDLLGRYPLRLERIPPADFGFGRTKNLASHLAQGQYLVFLSQDAEPATTTWLDRLVTPLAEDSVAGVYGRQLPRTSTKPGEKFFLHTTYPPYPRVHTGEMPRHGIAFSNVNAAVKRDLLLRYPFPEDVLMSEDQAWAREVLRAGYSLVYEPSAPVYHAHDYSLAGVFRRSFDSGAALHRILGRGFGPLRARGPGYLLEELGYLVQLGHAQWVPYTLLYELCRVTGYLLGTQGEHLPTALRRRFSAYGSLLTQDRLSEQQKEGTAEARAHGRGQA